MMQMQLMRSSRMLEGQQQQHANPTATTCEPNSLAQLSLGSSKRDLEESEECVQELLAKERDFQA